MLKVYRCNVRSILEYALQKWQNIPVYLSERIEFVQKRSFKIIYPDSSYNQALILTKETTLSSRREFLWLILTRTVTTIIIPGVHARKYNDTIQFKIRRGTCVQSLN